MIINLLYPLIFCFWVFWTIFFCFIFRDSPVYLAFAFIVFCFLLIVGGCLFVCFI
ncbi:hypothetical protein IMSAGC003_00400 [Lachnospiraceae bacterium]|nr:hypothetical protein IMSAGC003_00400 [Lachnospiraceae bacterium]